MRCNKYNVITCKCVTTIVIICKLRINVINKNGNKTVCNNFRVDIILK